MARKISVSRQFLKKSMFILLFLLLMATVVIHNADSTIRKASVDKLYTELDSIPKREVALLLGIIVEKATMNLLI